MHAEWSEEEQEIIVKYAYAAPWLNDAVAERRAQFLAAAESGVRLFLARASGRVKEDEEAVRTMLPPNTGAIDAALNRLAALAQDTAESRSATAKTWQEVERLKTDLDRERTISGEYADYRGASEKRIERLREERAALEDATKRLADGLAAAADDAATLRAEVERLRERVAELDRMWRAETTTADRYEEERDALRTKVADLEGLCGSLATERDQESKAAESARAWIRVVEKDMEDLDSETRQHRAEVERLKAELRSETKTKTDMAQRAAVAESRLAAIRERADDPVTAACKWFAIPSMKGSGMPPSHQRSAIGNATRLLLWLSEGDAPNPPGFSDGSSGTPNHSMPSNGSVGAAMGGHLDPWTGMPEPESRVTMRRTYSHATCLCHTPGGAPLCKAELHRCSTDCTHDDARMPGHFERVREGSEALATIIHRDSASDAYDDGVEAMRAACLEVVQRVSQTLALGPTEQEMLRAAIEGATP